MLAELQALEAVRNSKVILYATSDRQNLSLQIDEEVIEVFHEHLEGLGVQTNIDLFIYSRGGATIVPLPLVRLIRKYCQKFGAIVPFRAHSAASMICVGADEIYMTRKAELGPTDPQLTINGAQGQRIFASTDLFAFLDFARDQVGWQKSNTDSSLALLEFFHKYCQLPPDLIGKIYRMFTQSKTYIKELAASHANAFKLEQDVIESLSEALMAGFGSHDYKIDSHEAGQRLGLNVLPFDQNLENACNSLFGRLATHLKLTTPFLPQGLQIGAQVCEPLGVILSTVKQSSKQADIRVLGQQGAIALNLSPLPWT